VKRVNADCPRTPLTNELWMTSDRGAGRLTSDAVLAAAVDWLCRSFFLFELDTRPERLGLFYVRFMDDILVLAPTRAKLRLAIRSVNDTLASLWLEKHPDKTFIGRIARGFDFLGYHFGVGLLQLAGATIERFVAHATLLYERGRMGRADAPQLGTYVRRWRGWAGGGLKSVDENCRYRLAGSVHRALGLLPVSVA
jgi:RNA-directed DNA polymerase